MPPAAWHTDGDSGLGFSNYFVASMIVDATIWARAYRMNSDITKPYTKATTVVPFFAMPTSKVLISSLLARPPHTQPTWQC